MPAPRAGLTLTLTLSLPLPLAPIMTPTLCWACADCLMLQDNFGDTALHLALRKAPLPCGLLLALSHGPEAWP